MLLTCEKVRKSRTLDPIKKKEFGGRKYVTQAPDSSGAVTEHCFNFDSYTVAVL